MWDVIRGLVADGTTVLLTTQYLDEADQLADRIAVIDRGVKVAEGTPDQLKTSVVRPFTPNYSDVTLAIQDSLHPPAGINPQKSIDTLKSRLQTVADGGMY